MNIKAMTGAEMKAELVSNFQQLTPENRGHVLRLFLLTVNDPGFAEAYNSLPNAPGYDCPSYEDVKQLMNRHGKQVHL